MAVQASFTNFRPASQFIKMDIVLLAGAVDAMPKQRLYIEAPMCIETSELSK